MINGIVFSKDRAAQLKLFLDSFQINAKDVFDLKILYTSSNEDFNKGYERLIEIYPDFNWIKESGNFKQDVLNALEDTDSVYTSFFTDDDIIYRPLNEEEMTSKLEENVTKCYTQRCDNVIIPDFEDDKYIRWNWQVHYVDFGYPLSVDGHIFRTKEILKLTKKVPFHNPNSYEGRLQMFDNYPKKNMWAYKHSALVNSPSNIVQSTAPNRNGEEFGISAKELNDAFLSGKEIDYDAIDFSDITGCHQELELPFKELETKE
jgi:hypothetical protein